MCLKKGILIKMEIEEYLQKFDSVTKDPSLDAMEFFMKEFGSPHKKTKFIHIAGTNGKGSVCEMLNNILIKSGYRVRKIYVTTFNKIQ